MAEGQQEDFTKLSIEDKLAHKVWKARLMGYEEVTKLFKKIDDENSPEYSKYTGLVRKFPVESNAVAQEKALEATLAFADLATAAGKICSDVIAGIVTKCLNARPKTKELGISICLMYIEIEKQDIVAEEIMKGFGNKQPKIVAASISVIRRALEEFGASVFNIKALLKATPGVFEHSDKNVRAEAKLLAIELFKWVGAALKASIDGKIKPVQMKELEEEFSKLPPSPPAPPRLLRSKQALAQATPTGGDVASAGVEGAVAMPQPVEIDPYDLMDPVNMLDGMPKDFYERIADTKWKERKEALEAILPLARSPKLEPGDYGELVKVLRKVSGYPQYQLFAFVHVYKPLSNYCLFNNSCYSNQEVIMININIYYNTPTFNPFKMAAKPPDCALKKLEEQLTCSICLNHLTDPKTLTCLHTFCHKCLDELLDFNNQINCPVCRSTQELPEEGVNSLRTTFLVNNLLEVHEMLKKVTSDKMVLCDVCSESFATSYCQQCESFSCDSCMAFHNKWKKNSTHRILTLNELADSAYDLPRAKSDVIMKCTNHNKPLDIYCDTCEQLVCQHCTVRMHRDHDYDVVNDVYDLHCENIEKSIAPVDKLIIDAGIQSKSLKTSKRKLTRKGEKVKNDIQERAGKIVDSVFVAAAVLMNKVDKTVGDQEAIINSKLDEIEATVSKLQACKDYVKQSLSVGSPQQVLSSKSELIKHVTNTVSTCCLSQHNNEIAFGISLTNGVGLKQRVIIESIGDVRHNSPEPKLRLVSSLSCEADLEEEVIPDEVKVPLRLRPKIIEPIPDVTDDGDNVQLSSSELGYFPVAYKSNNVSPNSPEHFPVAYVNTNTSLPHVCEDISSTSCVREDTSIACDIVYVRENTSTPEFENSQFSVVHNSNDSNSSSLVADDNDFFQ